MVMASNIAPTGLAKELAERERDGRPVRIGLIGAGEMGADIAARTATMDGVEVAAISEVDQAKAHRAVEIARQTTGASVDVSSSDALNAVVESGRTAVVDDPDALLESGLIDVIVDATGVPAVGAEIGLKGMERGKHLVMMNVEADVTIGAYLKREAERLGTIYTLGAGDEPSACMELIEFVTAMGHAIVCAGKGKNNPLDVDATADSCAEEAARRDMNPRMLAEFVDGSKTMVEMAAIANATGLIPDVDGMHGPAANREDIARTLIPARDGGVLSNAGRVDYSVGKGVAPGVFVVVDAGHPRVRERLTDLKMGEGPYYAFLRPYHLTSLEVPLTCARAAIRGKADMVPLDRPSAEAAALAKRDIASGETLGQLGESDYRAWAMEAGRARAARAHPAGLLAGAKTIAPIARGDLVTEANCALPDTAIVRMRRRQDAMQDAMMRGG